MIAALCQAYPALDPRELHDMSYGVACYLIRGRVSLMRRVQAESGSPPPPPEQEGVLWDQAHPGPGGTTIVPVRGIEGLKALARMGARS